MSLNQADLQAIKQLLDTAIDQKIPPIIDKLESRLIERLESFEETFSMRVENGLQEIRNHLTTIGDAVGRIERIQQAELERNDHQDVAIKKIRKVLHAV